MSTSQDQRRIVVRACWNVLVEGAEVGQRRGGVDRGVEGTALHAFEGKAPFSPDTLSKIRQLKEVYGLELTAADAHVLEETP